MRAVWGHLPGLRSRARGLSVILFILILSVVGLILTGNRLSASKKVTSNEQMTSKHNLLIPQHVFY